MKPDSPFIETFLSLNNPPPPAKEPTQEEREAAELRAWLEDFQLGLRVELYAMTPDENEE